MVKGDLKKQTQFGKEFEKTKPIYRQANRHKLLYKRTLWQYSALGDKKNKANFDLNQAVCSLLGLFGGVRIQVLEYEEESILAADAVKGGDAEVLLYGIEFRQQAEIEQVSARL